MENSNAICFEVCTDLLVRRIDKSIPLPVVQTQDSVGLDLYARTAVTIAPNDSFKVPLNVCIKVPRGHGAFLFPRSSLFSKKKLILSNSVGVIDRDYCGNNDEISALLINTSDSFINISAGERLVQLVILPTPRVIIKEVDDLNSVDRGGYGTTGGYDA